jgi:peptidoglycan/LPS O-acetylase OafA/YrhL
MGALRFLLAMSVVSAHTFGASGVGVGGQVAVELFFVLSGFLISYILTESEKYRSLSDFYLSRILRLFPLYLLVTFLSLGLVLALLQLGNKPTVAMAFMDSGSMGKSLLLASNGIIFLQDLTFFLADSGSSLQLATTFTEPAGNLHLGLLTPQAWSLSLELMFYALAPALVKSKRALIWACLGSFLLRIFMIFGLHLANDPWIYRSFPVQLCAFAIGALAHQYSRQVAWKWFFGSDSRWMRWPRYAIVLISVALFSQIPIDLEYKQTILLFLVVSSLPELFNIQNLSKLDRWLSNLSFPIYLWHILVINMLSIFFSRFQIESQILLFALTTCISISLSLISNHLLDSRIERIRQRLKAA